MEFFIGWGTYAIVYDENEIEEKVIDALAKTYCPMRKITNIKALDA